MDKVWNCTFARPFRRGCSAVCQGTGGWCKKEDALVWTSHLHLFRDTLYDLATGRGDFVCAGRHAPEPPQSEQRQVNSSSGAHGQAICRATLRCGRLLQPDTHTCTEAWQKDCSCCSGHGAHPCTCKNVNSADTERRRDTGLSAFQTIDMLCALGHCWDFVQ